MKTSTKNSSSKNTKPKHGTIHYNENVLQKQEGNKINLFKIKHKKNKRQAKNKN